jgi:hypothetical protein
MRLVLAFVLGLLIGLLLAGSVPIDRERQFARCALEAQRAAPGTIVQPGATTSNVLVESVIRLCMEGAGFSLSTTDQDCPGGLTSASTAACYAPRGWLTRTVYRAAAWLNQP